MRIRGLPALISLLSACVFATSAMAAPAPYIRIDFGGNQLKMAEGNAQIQRSENFFTDQGLPASFQKIGTGFGPSGSAGLWVFPWFRIGASYSYFQSIRKNHLHVPGQVFFAQDLDFRMTEVGGEAAIRIERLGGLTLGGNLAGGRATMIEGFSAEDVFSQYYQDAVAHRTKTTYGGFVGIDQTNENGLAGFIRAGYQYRDMGRMPCQLRISDGYTTIDTPGDTIPLDYSGFYIKVGIGYDLQYPQD